MPLPTLPPRSINGPSLVMNHVSGFSFRVPPATPRHPWRGILGGFLWMLFLIAFSTTNAMATVTADAGSNQTVVDGAAVVLSAAASQSDAGAIVAYQWTQTAGAAVSLSASNKIAVSFVAPSVGFEGDILTFRLTVTDETGDSASDTVTVTVKYDNTPPTANAGVDQTVVEGTAVLLDGTASTDADGAIISWHWAQTAGPEVSLSSDAAPRVTFVAPADVFEPLTFRLTVRDNEGLTTTDSVTVTVHAARVPVAAAGGDVTVTSGAVVSLDGARSYGVDAEIAAYYWEQTDGPTVTLSSTSQAVVYFTAPVVGAAGKSLVFRLTVMDQRGLMDEDTVIVTVSYANQPPVANAGQDQISTEGALTLLDGSRSYDPDGGIASYHWRQTDGTPVEITGADRVRATFTAPPIGVMGLIFELTVTDGEGLLSMDEVHIVVNAAQLPIASAGPDQTVHTGDAVTLDGTLSFATGAAISGFAWRQVLDGASDTPVVTLLNANTTTPGFTAPPVSANGVSLVFELTVTDSLGRQGTDQTLVHIVHVNLPPVASAGDDAVVLEGSTVVLNGSASYDPDGGIASYQWSQRRGTPVTLSDDGKAIQVSFVTPSVGSEPLVFQLTVRDQQGLMGTDDITLTVNDNGISLFPEDATSFTSATGWPLAVGVRSGGSLFSLGPVAASSVTATTNRPSELPYGLVSAGVTTSETGGAVVLTVYLPEPAPADYVWAAYNSRDGWRDLEERAVFNETRDTVTLTLIDGGGGDDDAAFQADGIVATLSGLALASESKSDKNSLVSCFIQAAGAERRLPFTPMIPITLAVSLVAVAWGRLRP